MSKKDNFEHDKFQHLVKDMLISLGEDPTREGLKETPKRVAKSFQFLTSGNHDVLEDIVKGALFSSTSHGMVTQKNIDFYSMCEHHLLPFFGHVHIGYIPDKAIIGLSKMGRVVDMFARRLQVQEHLTQQIAEAVMQVLKPKGVVVQVDAVHLCMMMRGVQKQNGATVTQVTLGEFDNNPALISQFLAQTHH